MHGGRSGRGDQWHVVQWPGPDASPERIERKIRDLARREQRRLARVAAMSPERRAKYEKHRMACRPRSAAEREQDRQDRVAAKLLNTPRPAAPESPDMVRMREEMHALDAEATRLTAWLAEHGEDAEQTARSDDDR